MTIDIEAIRKRAWNQGRLDMSELRQDRRDLLTALAERDATIRELREALAVYVHAFDTDNAVPPFIVAKARAALAKGA